MSRRSARPVWPRSSDRARRSPRSPTTCGRTRDRATSVVGDPATRRAAELSDAAVAGDRLALARLLTAVENRTPGRGGGPPAALPDGRARASRRHHRAARLRQVHARRGADRARCGGRSHRGGHRGRSVEPDHRRRAARRPGPDAGVCGRSTACSSARWRRAGTPAGSRATSTAAAAVLDAAGLRPDPDRDRGDGPERGRGGGRGGHDRRPRGARDGRRGPGDQGRAARGRRPGRRQQGRQAGGATDRGAAARDARGDRATRRLRGSATAEASGRADHHGRHRSGRPELLAALDRHRAGRSGGGVVGRPPGPRRGTGLRDRRGTDARPVDGSPPMRQARPRSSARWPRTASIPTRPPTGCSPRTTERPHGPARPAYHPSHGDRDPAGVRGGRRADGSRHRPGPRRGRPAGHVVRARARARRSRPRPDRRQPGPLGRQGPAHRRTSATPRLLGSSRPPSSLARPRRTSSSRPSSRTSRSSRASGTTSTPSLRGPRSSPATPRRSRSIGLAEAVDAPATQRSSSACTSSAPCR